MTKTLTLLAVLGGLASCGPNDACAGWRKINILDKTLDFMAENDEVALKALIGHQETGIERGCWG